MVEQRTGTHSLPSDIHTFTCTHTYTYTCTYTIVVYVNGKTNRYVRILDYYSAINTNEPSRNMEEV